MRIRPFDESDTESVVTLWHAAGLTRPWNDPHRDIARKLEVQRELFLVVEVEPPVSAGTSANAGAESRLAIAATVMAGYDGHRGWVNYLAVADTHRGQGLGRALMAEVERLLEQRGCPKLNLQVRSDNEQALGFYRALGYDVDAAVSLGKRLIAD